MVGSAFIALLPLPLFIFSHWPPCIFSLVMIPFIIIRWSKFLFSFGKRKYKNILHSSNDSIIQSSKHTSVRKTLVVIRTIKKIIDLISIQIMIEFNGKGQGHHWPLFIYLLFRATPAAYGGSLARRPIGATTAGLNHSHSNTRSEPHLQPTPELTAMLDH